MAVRHTQGAKRYFATNPALASVMLLNPRHRKSGSSSSASRVIAQAKKLGLIKGGKTAKRKNLSTHRASSGRVASDFGISGLRKTSAQEMFEERQQELADELGVGSRRRPSRKSGSKRSSHRVPSGFSPSTAKSKKMKRAAKIAAFHAKRRAAEALRRKKAKAEKRAKKAAWRLHTKTAKAKRLGLAANRGKKPAKRGKAKKRAGTKRKTAKRTIHRKNSRTKRVSRTTRKTKKHHTAKRATRKGTRRR